MGDFNGANYADDFVGDLVNFVAGESFQTMFESFFLTYALEFSNDEEHKLRYYELYQTFHDMFESQLETFCNKKNISQGNFCLFFLFFIHSLTYSQLNSWSNAEMHHPMMRKQNTT